MKTPESWSVQEQIVAALERTLAPDAEILLNQRLPVLEQGISGTREIDVLIRQGKPPRDTVSIVEVQKRSRKPSLNDFNGWIAKMKEVGAQHLICVSEVGFSSSICERARSIGPTVRLLTLTEILDSKEKSFLPFMETDLLILESLKIKKFWLRHHLALTGVTEYWLAGAHFDSTEPRFRLPDGKAINLHDLLDRAFFIWREDSLDNLQKHKDQESRLVFSQSVQNYFVKFLTPEGWTCIPETLRR